MCIVALHISYLQEVIRQWRRIVTSSNGTSATGDVIRKGIRQTSGGSFLQP